VAGLAAARALSIEGASVTVLERRPVGASDGAGLLIYPAAWRALERLGALDSFRSVAVPLQGIATFDQDGRELNSLDSHHFEKRYGYPLAGVHRADLLTALLHQLAAEVRRGTEVTALEVGDRVKVLTNVEPMGADVLVGADGIRSRIRQALGLAAEPRRSGYVAWRGVARQAPLGFSSDTAGIVVGAGRHGGWVPVADGRVYWFLTGDEGEKPDGGMAFEMVRDWKGPLRELIAATELDAVLFNDLIDRAPDRRWGAGPVTLVGDAAHAMLPSMAQGANQALEDASALLAAVRQHGMNAAAFRAYEQRRQARTARLVRMSRQMMPVFQWRRASARRLRAALLAIPPALMQRQMEWLYRGES
jgi:2-polyprenyl-6-methoxyphenol hydroxylase-like FAD-dependent oxidoreductase